MFNQRGDKFIYRDKEEGDVIEAEVYYTKGGANYFSGTTNRRGVYFSFHGVNINTDERGVTTKSFTLFGNGVKFFALPLKAKSAKQVQRVVDAFAPHVAELVELYKTDKEATYPKVQDIIRELNGGNHGV